ncbi:MAG: adenylyltransferase/cytidyltransferase family protein, partial [Oscillospiraceae bacterium]|nr:adenylyltransferase/cytidyltransferase family protein [Oscillospiraceae bacterium]
MKIAIVPGSFDPITKGHVDIIERTGKLFDKVIAVVLVNPTKTPTFTTEERVDMIKRVTGHIPNLE